MTRFAVTLLTVTLCTTASAAPTAVRLGQDLDGHDVVIGEEAIALTWSMDCLACRGNLDKLDRLRTAGVQVVAINTDPVASRVRVKHYLQVRGLDALTVVQDTSTQFADNTAVVMRNHLGGQALTRTISRIPVVPRLAGQ